MDVTVRNVDDDAYRRLKAQAALEDRKVGEVLTDAIEAYLQEGPREGSGSLSDLQPVDLGPGAERLSVDHDEDLYGRERDDA